MKRLAAIALALAACDPAPDPDAPRLLAMRDLVAMAEAGAPYVTDSKGNAVLPMTAVVTPPGREIFFESPPFAPAATRHAGEGPRLNVLPGLAEGRFTPYVTVEMWPNDFGELWVQPLYVFVTRDAAGRVSPTVGAPVFGVDANHRFYSPFWRLKQVVVPASEVRRLGTDAQPRSVKAILDSGWEILDGGLVLCPIVPDELELDPAIAKVADGEPRPAVRGVWGDVLKAEYTEAGLSRLKQLRLNVRAGWYEGRKISWLGFGAGWFRVLEGDVVEGSPIFMFADRRADGTLVPLGLPNVGGHAPPFSGRPLFDPEQMSNLGALWDVVLVVRPKGSEPFFPGTPAWAALKQRMKEKLTPGVVDANPLDTSAGVDALEGIDRYAGRLARRPACFRDARTFTRASEWAPTCDFLDTQERIEKSVSHDAFVDPKVRVLCPFVLWTDEVRP